MAKKSEVEAEGSGGQIMNKVQRIDVPILRMGTLKLRLKGDSLIVNHFGNKSIQQMADQQQGRAKMKKEPKDPQACFESARYVDSKGKDCILAVGIKHCIVNAARFVDGLHMTMLWGGVTVKGELLPIKYKTRVMREDVVRVGKFPNKTADLRYRPEYVDWEVDCDVVFNSNVFTAEQIFNLVRLAGFHVGLCEWRPEKKGEHGRFEVELREGKKAA